MGESGYGGWEWSRKRQGMESRDVTMVYETGGTPDGQGFRLWIISGLMCCCDILRNE